MRDTTVKWLSTIHTWMFRATNGEVGKRLVANDVMLLTTKGRITGTSHTVPLLYLRDDDGLVVIASYGGRPHHPEWYRNLVADPLASVQVLGEHRTVTARTADADERAAWWPRIEAAYSGYAEYQSKTDREIPVVFLEPIGTV